MMRGRSTQLLVAVGLLHGAAGLQCSQALGAGPRTTRSGAASMASKTLSDAVRGGAVAREYDPYADMEIIEDTNTADVVRKLAAIGLGDFSIVIDGVSVFCCSRRASSAPPRPLCCCNGWEPRSGGSVDGTTTPPSRARISSLIGTFFKELV